jgi:hypothetical protein
LISKSPPEDVPPGLGAITPTVSFQNEEGAKNNLIENQSNGKSVYFPAKRSP